MAYALHTLVAFGGRMTTLTPGDQWQCGVRVRVQDTDQISWLAGLTDPVTYMNAIATPLHNWWKNASVTTTGSEYLGMRGDAYLDWLKVNNIGTDGKYLDKTASHRVDYDSSAAAGPTANSACPPFVTICVSFLTALTRGRGHRGRIYLPFSVPMNAAGTVSSQAQAQCNGTARALLSVLAAPLDAGKHVIPVIASRLNGATNPITAVSTGGEMDVQRRRKEQLTENPYLTRAWP